MYVMDCICLHLKWSSAHALGVVFSLASFVTIDEQLQQNQGCHFPHAGCASWGLSLFSFDFIKLTIQILSFNLHSCPSSAIDCTSAYMYSICLRTCQIQGCRKWVSLEMHDVFLTPLFIFNKTLTVIQINIWQRTYLF